MISKNEIKLITALGRKKFRDQEGLFVAEGPKVIRELLDEGLELKSLFVKHLDEWDGFSAKEISDDELRKISFLTTPNEALAVFEKPKVITASESDLIVALDAVRDPGNLGTIIRLCDWFGVRRLMCSTDTVDCFNPKVVQATMGSLARVQINYLDLELYLKETTLPVYGGFMDGESIYSLTLPSAAVIVLGNEANGISRKIENCINNRVSVPRFGNLQKTESLNVSTAGAILLSEFRRN